VRETSTSSPSIFTGYTGTGRVAGRPDGLPVRRSKAEPCNQHSIMQSSTSPSERETFACEQMSLIANTSPSARTMDTGVPSSSTRLGVLSSSSLSDLAEDEPKRVDLNGVPVALVRTEGEVFAINDICSHANVSLSEGEVEDCMIECWLHGSSFDLRSGKPSGLPATKPVPVYPVKIEGDDVLVSVNQES
jgi:3-phenylpropionate/trans-cinnamate dioxygenase ferredoxin subunit